ncbi:unnamed protein product [Linum tenue]|uniref:Uncharacterized protein n=1 Tax=Linum tenue TaxID=586396 RepID=A0AAV0PQH0_9ROSI|nr:unnamed protein product [Linum tenue]
MSSESAAASTTPAGGGGGGVGGIQIQPQSRSRLPDFLQSVNLKHVKLGYHYLVSHLLTLCLIPLMAVIVIEATQLNPDDIRQLWLHLQYNLKKLDEDEPPRSY